MSWFVRIPQRLRLIGCVLVTLLAACATTDQAPSDPFSGGAVLVAGGSGRAGTCVLDELAARKIAFRATTRSIATARERLGTKADGVSWVEADLRDPVAARAAMKDVTMVVSVIGSRELTGDNSAEFVDYGAVRNLVDAAREAGVKRFVLLTAIGTTDRESFANKLFKGALEWRYRGEQHLRASGVPYTVVRPAGLVNDAANAKGVRLWQGDDWRSHTRKTISRADLAAVLVESLVEPGARNASFEIANDAGEPPGTWRAQLAGLKAD